MLNPDPSLRYATSWLHLASEMTPLFCPTLRIHRVLQFHKNDVEVILFNFSRTCLISAHRWAALRHWQPLDSRLTGFHNFPRYLLFSHGRLASISYSINQAGEPIELEGNFEISKFSQIFDMTHGKYERTEQFWHFRCHASHDWWWWYLTYNESDCQWWYKMKINSFLMAQ